MKRFSIRRIRLQLSYCPPVLEHGVLHPAAFVIALTVLILFIGTNVIASDQQSTNGAVVIDSASSRKGPIRSRGQAEQPQSGWLYVLDSNDMKPESQILLVDPEQGRVVRTFKAAKAPDMALSPDGTRLYIASTKYGPDGGGRKDLLEVIDTASGTVLQTVDSPDRWISTVRVYPSQMAISPDGHWLYIFMVHITMDSVSYDLATFDTVQGRFLTKKTPLPYCGTASLLPLPDGQRLNVICYNTNDVRFLKLTAIGMPVVPTKGDTEVLPAKVSLGLRGVAMHGQRVGPGFISPDGSTFTVIMGDGRFFQIDNESRKILHTSAIDSDARKNMSSDVEATNIATNDWLADSWIRYQDAVISPDETKFYVGIGRLAHLHQGIPILDRIVVLDSQTLKRREIIKTTYPFESLALGKDGRYLYAISPEQAAIMVIDTVTQREVRTIYGIGTSPIRAIVAP